ncbi:DUF2971 domain-containing protein [Bacteroides graminisolvens]|uniref:DUF2971 domain-containing protein n=1 Tax=Bacteroides graminisolvens TaxID=477666 RepID=UPI0024096755|nr:DUF2971 domain-containing protein [Bacteroides graminisolvens]
MIEKLELYLSSPDNFNDPFDCYEGLVGFKITKKFVEEYVTKAFATRKMGSREQRKRFEKQLIKDPRSLGIDINAFFENYKKKFGICCFSWDNKNPVMWAHYADNHKGICVGLKNLYPVQEKLYGIYPVDYLSKMEQYQFTSFEDEKYWRQWLLTKSISWEYEQEVRLISKSYNGKLKFPKEAINEIYLGLLTSKEDEKRVIKLLVSHNFPSDVKLYKMIVDKKAFSLQPKELKWAK